MTYRRLILVAFVLNGLNMLGLKALGEMGPAALPIALLVLYATSTPPALLDARSGAKRLDRNSLLIGVIAGVASVIGISAQVLACGLIPAYVVFPVSAGGTLLLVVIVGRLVFKERIGPYGIAGMALGAAAVALLSV